MQLSGSGAISRIGDMFPLTHAMAAIHLPIRRLYNILLGMLNVTDVTFQTTGTQRSGYTAT